MKAKVVTYWITTGLLAFFIGSGGAAEVARVPGNVEGLVALGYPVYFIMLIGVWKVLGAVAVLLPGWPRLKEWAYAGMFFNMSGAAVSNIAVNGSNELWHVVADVVVAGLVVASWALRPAGRRLGSVPPARKPAATASGVTLAAAAAR